MGEHGSDPRTVVLVTVAIGGPCGCSACGKQGKRVQNIPDDPAVVTQLGLPRALACSGDCMKRILAGEFALPDGFGVGWMK